jgi:hypothetical protein
MQSSIFVFGTDLLHEGYDAVLDNIRDRGGIEGVSLSANYHHARDVFPHNPKYHVFRNEGDVAWFKPERSRYASGMTPRRATEAGARDVLGELCEQAGRRGIPVTAWTIFLHNSRLATEFPDCTTRNVYGDPYLTDLCPANPRVRDCCRELASDIARYPVRRLLAESLHYRPLEHGAHHERYLIDLSGEARALLSLCFCEHCRAVGERAGIVCEDLASAIRTSLDRIWNDEPGANEEPLLGPDAADSLAKYVDARTEVVTSLVAEVREAIAPTGVEFCFVDHAGAMAHVMRGASADDDILISARKLGIDPVAIAAVADEYFVLGYTDTPERLETMLQRYRQLLGPDRRLALGLRPLSPDCRVPENLRAKLDIARRAKVQGVDFYHYAMMPLPRLDWIRNALGEDAA